MTDTASVPPVVEVAQAVAATVSNPKPAILVEDVVLAHKLAMDLKTALNCKHPSIWQLVTTLFHLMLDE